MAKKKNYNKEASAEEQEAANKFVQESDSSEEHHEDGPYKEDDPNAGKGDETSAEETDNVPKVDNSPEEPEEKEPLEEAPETPAISNEAAKETVEVIEEAEPAPEEVAPEVKVNGAGDPLPIEGEDHEVYCNRYMNHPNVLRRISPPHRRSAAEATWKTYKTS